MGDTRRSREGQSDREGDRSRAEIRDQREGVGEGNGNSKVENKMKHARKMEIENRENNDKRTVSKDRMREKFHHLKANTQG